MKTRREMVIHLNIDWRLLLVLSLLILCLALVSSGAIAQEVQSFDINRDMLAPVTRAPGTALPDVENVAEGGAQPGDRDGDLVMTMNREWVPIDAIGGEPAAGADVSDAAGGASAGGRHVYLTDSSYYANQVLTACASGYHAASFWEIFDISNITYDYTHPAAHTKTDSGHGPPSYWYGWIRTGWSSSSSDVAGTGNCLGWTSTDGADYGVSVRLTRQWETVPGDIGTWDPNSFACSTSGPVWCVRD